MRNNINYLITGAIAILLGIFVGYLIFHKDQVVLETHEAHVNMDETIEGEGEEIWTCSMHPQIRREEPGDCPICGMDLIPISKSSSRSPLVLEMTNDAIRIANIQTTIIGNDLSPNENTSTLSGKVQVDERLAASQVAHIPGRIEKLFVTYTGEEVQKGQRLATIYSPELITAQQELFEAIKLKELNPALLQAAKNKLKYWKIDPKEIDAIAESGVLKETFTLYADEPGVVTNRRISVGDYVKKGEPLLDLMGLDRIWVLFDVYEQDLANISVGDKIQFTTPSLPEKTFKTNITFIDPVMNPNTRTISIRTEVGNARRNLKPEMFVKGQIQKKKQNNPDKILVPKSAVLWTGKRSVVYVKIPETEIPSYEFREITIGNSVGDQYQVLEGISAGEEVVTNGSFTIDAAAQLNNQASMINRQVTVANNPAIQEVPDYTTSTAPDFMKQLSSVIKAYISLKNALVDADHTESVKSAQAILSDLKNVDMALLDHEPHLFWMEQQDAIKDLSEKIILKKNIDEQRAEFHRLSEAIIRTIKAFGNSDQVYFVQHCPMANSDKGANWLSENAAILNPYFGAQMLTCGFPADTIPTTIL